MQPTKKKLFYTVYPFMHTDLHLSGIPKEVFGVIFGFWNKNERKEVMVSYSQINEMTGATDPSIASAIKRLKEYGFIDAETTEGKKSKYTVHLPESLISEFDEVYRGKNTANNQPSPYTGPKQKKQDLREAANSDDFGDIPEDD